ncbi:glycosyltransferase [Ramlibacter ginsenosidimutans]|uniref:Glycosyltransferase n=1 Tax=Ramlibacter ginsenosidimutans TaxID=502333 RepID=A0A934WLL9_9BURK|nr:glycosyltransferase family 2 protein [Ramlibacter ginsenosidimutans]MBK6005765.1 glycosyltransferase [Ramlibacter ginsenosidimutans]
MLGNPPLLTVAVPTYNRLGCLRLLLSAIGPEVQRLHAEGTVELLVCDNASTDGTTEFLEGLAIAGWLRVLRSPFNVGADANFIRCLTEARGRHVWMIGDDDLPLPGVLERVAAFLARRRCDLLYLPARWHSGDLAECVPAPSPVMEPQPVNAGELAIRANAYVTFLSSWVLDRERYLSLADARPTRFEGSFLAQLEWHLALLAAGGPLYAAPEAWLLARAGHGGGYALFETFVQQYHRIIGERLARAPSIRDFLQEHILRGYLPGLVWGIRLGKAGAFRLADWQAVEAMMARVWPDRPRQRRRITWIASWPQPLARLVMATAWLDTRAWTRRLRTREKWR